MLDKSADLELFILDTILDDIQVRVRQASPHLVWGLLIGKRDAANVVTQVANFSNSATKNKTISRIEIDYTQVADYLRTSLPNDHQPLGYYFSSNGSNVSHRIAELRFFDTYYVLETTWSNGQFSSNVQHVIRETAAQSTVHMEREPVTQIEARLRQMSITQDRITNTILSEQSVPIQRNASNTQIAEIAVDQSTVLPDQTHSKEWGSRLFQWVKSLCFRSKMRADPGKDVGATSPSEDGTGDGSSSTSGASYTIPVTSVTASSTVPAGPLVDEDNMRIEILPTSTSSRPVASLHVPARPCQVTPTSPASTPVQVPPPRQVAPLRAPSRSARQQQIMDVCMERGITTLMHFTRLNNLESILSKGLMPRADLEREYVGSAVFNDIERIDGCKNAVCLSISFPNYKTFYSWKQKRDETWVILGIDARVLWELDCAFCASNASANPVRTIPLYLRRKPESLERMFQDSNLGGRAIDRSQLPIPSNFPTNPQAEVLAFGTIEQKYIHAVYFDDDRYVWQFQTPPHAGVHHPRISVDSTYFKPRCDWEFWKR